MSETIEALYRGLQEEYNLNCIRLSECENRCKELEAENVRLQELVDDAKLDLEVAIKRVGPLKQKIAGLLRERRIYKDKSAFRKLVNRVDGIIFQIEYGGITDVLKLKSELIEALKRAGIRQH